MARELTRLFVFAPDPVVRTWIEEELADPSFVREVGETVQQVVAALVASTPTRPQILIADFDDMSAADILALHTARDTGWFGAIIAIGTVPAEIHASLTIERALPPFGVGALTKAVRDVGLHKPTTRMKKLPLK
jgi:hypothetical protein